MKRGKECIFPSLRVKVSGTRGAKLEFIGKR